MDRSCIASSLLALSLMACHADDLVVDEYYKTGLAINQRIEKQRAAVRRGVSAELTLLGRQLQVRTRGAIDTTALRLQFSHPLEAEHDFEVHLQATAPGLYVSTLPGTPAPNWHWTLDAGADGDWRLSGSLSTANFLDGATP